MDNETAIQQIQSAAEALDYVDLQKAARIIEKEQKRREKEARRQAQQEMKQVAQKYGLNLEEVAAELAKGPKGSGGSRGKVPPKYRHPDDPQKTWTGRGRKPVWVKDWEAENGDIEQLRIPES
ncbi:H-NS family nucleoid-associated regulatory protein [Halorhodospira neutriphila]|uniref:Trans-acting regulatory HvrA protein n=1 Tax=Halorhodospira neutriphila TaxID=168379 RepID=A0ABS1E225_9GAMM|nr:H-NS histone family protein [Halorhodospira neutriphila]MBK1725835.1 trans-acting regulatory HvrA protein [Halorhodospira neutriphila]